MNNAFYSSQAKINFSNSKTSFDFKLKGKLHANTNATSIWGNNSEIVLYDMYIALSGEIELEEYVMS